MNNTQTKDQFIIIAQKLMIIFGISMCIFGLIGNILNICIFTIWSFSRKKSNRFNYDNDRTSNSSLYLLASSIANLVVIIYPLLTRIMFDGYNYLITQNNSIILCKFRYYILHTFDLISLTCICLATFDRYLISSRKVRLRELSPTKNQTIIIISFLIFMIALHSIPLIVFFNVSITGQCMIFSIKYSYYYLYVFQISLHGLIPIIFLSIFGILTFRQLRIITQNNLNSDRQLARMLLLMSIAIILSSIPNCIEQIYDTIVANNNREYSSRYFLYHVISSILFYTNPVTSFYIFYFSTPNFRLQLRNLIPYNREVDYLVPNPIQSRILLPN
jgi:hypothetical protein